MLARLLLGGCAGTTFFLRFLLGTIQIKSMRVSTQKRFQNITVRKRKANVTSDQ